jgi:hypothetical protein
MNMGHMSHLSPSIHDKVKVKTRLKNRIVDRMRIVFFKSELPSSFKNLAKALTVYPSNIRFEITY